MAKPFNDIDPAPSASAKRQSASAPRAQHDQATTLLNSLGPGVPPSQCSPELREPAPAVPCSYEQPRTPARVPSSQRVNTPPAAAAYSPSSQRVNTPPAAAAYPPSSQRAYELPVGAALVRPSRSSYAPLAAPPQERWSQPSNEPPIHPPYAAPQYPNEPPTDPACPPSSQHAPGVAASAPSSRRMPTSQAPGPSSRRAHDALVSPPSSRALHDEVRSARASDADVTLPTRDSDTVTDIGDPTVHTPCLELPAATLPAIDNDGSAAAPDSLARAPSITDHTSSVDNNVGQVFGGKYLIEHVLGEGGMGIVYLARHQAINKRVAIKLLHATRDPQVVERFKVEAQAASSIGDEHIVDITDFAELSDGSTYFVMEYLEGKPLSKLYHELSVVPAQRLARIALQVAEGVAAAHAHGIVHRDLKPDNVFLCKRAGFDADFVKILDFGIAKVGQGNHNITKTGAVFGTPHYMSPEQASGNPVDVRTDVYSLGIMLYEGAVGCVPFQADHCMGILTQHMYKNPIAPRAHPQCPRDLSPSLEVIIMRCLRKKPEERYATMDELAADLERFLRGEIPRAVHDMMALSAGYQTIARSALAAAKTPQRESRPRHDGRARVLPIGFFVALLALGMGVGFISAVIWKGTRPRRPVSTALADSASLARPVEAPPIVETPAPIASAAPVAPPFETVSPSVSTSAPTRPVLVLTQAPNAHLFENERELGEMPTNVHLAKGTSRTVVVRARGYLDKPLVIDDHTASKVHVTLSRLPPPARSVQVVPSSPTQPSRPTSNTDRPDDPFGSKPH